MEHVEGETNHADVMGLCFFQMEKDGYKGNEEGRALLQNPRHLRGNRAEIVLAGVCVASVPCRQEEKDEEDGDSDANQNEAYRRGD